jgi:predicted DNA-binding ribbon-helix-helix protein
MARQDSEFIAAKGGKKILRGFNIRVGDRRTSVRLSPVVADAVEKIAEREGCGLDQLYSYIKKRGQSVTPAIRVFVMLYYRDAATEAGHARAGHAFES